MRTDVIPVSYAAGTYATPAVNVSEYLGGTVLIGAVWTTASLGLTTCTSPDGTFVPVIDNSLGYLQLNAKPNVAVTLPLETIGGLRYIRVISHTGGTVVNQAAATPIQIIRKG